MLGQARAAAERLNADLRPHQDLYWTGYVQDALKEYVEASCVYRAVRGEPLPAPSELGVAAAAFLNGLGETVGELRRYTLDLLRHDTEPATCEALLGTMDDVYSLLVTMDYPDALTSGLRRTTDSVRGIVERTRGDLTTALRQRALTEALERLETRLQPAAIGIEMGLRAVGEDLERRQHRSFGLDDALHRRCTEFPVAMWRHR